MMVREPVVEPLFKPEDKTPYTSDVTPWSEVRYRLEEAMTYWLATGRPDGRPHVMPVNALCEDGILYFVTRPKTRKGKNLAHSPYCVVTVGSAPFEIVVEGDAMRVTDGATLERLAERFHAKYEWHLFAGEHEVYDEGGSAYHAYAVQPRTAFAINNAASTATRWRF